MSVIFVFLTCSVAAFAAEDEPIFTFELLSDPHIGFDGTEETFITALNAIEADKDNIDALVIAGDLTNHGEEPQIKQFYETLTANTTIDNIIPCVGNHDLGQMTPSDECRPNQIKYRNEYTGITSDKIYYSVEVNGFKFIVLGCEGNNSNTATITDTQIQFLKDELKDGSENGKPCFVICHWPLKYTHGSFFLWPIIPGGTLYSVTSKKIKNILSEYDNAFYISGHLHVGVINPEARNILGCRTVDSRNGYNLVNAPSLGKSNRIGKKSIGQGMEFQVYRDKVVILSKNYVTGEIYSDCTYEIALQNFNYIPEPIDIPA